MQYWKTCGHVRLTGTAMSTGAGYVDRDSTTWGSARFCSKKSMVKTFYTFIHWAEPDPLTLTRTLVPTPSPPHLGVGGGFTQKGACGAVMSKHRHRDACLLAMLNSTKNVRTTSWFYAEFCVECQPWIFHPELVTPPSHTVSLTEYDVIPGGVCNEAGRAV